jgi:Gas vesicle synthesis protein GvpL/GvpF
VTGLLVLAVAPADRIEPDLFLQGKGLPPGLQAVSAAGLAAVAAEAPEGGLKGRDRSTLLPWLQSSQKVIERLMARGPVLPVALGTVLEDPGRIRHMLASGGRVLEAALEALGRCWQMDLSVRWDLGETVARLMADVPAGMIDAAATGNETARCALDAALAALVAGERRRVQTLVGTALRSVARDIIISEPVEPDGVVGIAMLVDHLVLRHVETAIDRLDHDFEGRLTYRLIGPLAPYSFATVQVHLAPEAALAGACASLGVERHAAPEKVKAAYRRAVVGLHPDLVPHGSHAAVENGSEDGGSRAARLEAVNAAYRALWAEYAPVTVGRQDEVVMGRDD